MSGSHILLTFCSDQSHTSESHSPRPNTETQSLQLSPDKSLIEQPIMQNSNQHQKTRDFTPVVIWARLMSVYVHSFCVEY